MESKLQQQAPQKAQTNKPNLTGIPTQMKLDFEQRSGLSFDDVRVHYNSDKPAQLQALAYTQGTQVYVGPGQERHLPHELGHVVQQKHGMVYPTKFVNGFAVNDSSALENMADSIFYRASSIPESREYQIGNRLSNVIQTMPPKKRPLTPPKLTQAEIDDYKALIDKEKQKNKQGKKPKRNQKSTKPPIIYPYLKERYYTMSSYRFTPLKKVGKNLPSRELQGPHTVAHVYYGQLMTTQPWRNIFINLIAPNTPIVVQKIIENELGPSFQNMFPRFNEYISRYATLYADLCAAMNGAVPPFDATIGTKMMEIIEMHPYSCYGWNRAQKYESRGEIGGKGEQAIDINDTPEILIGRAHDIHSKFKDMDAFKEFLNQRFYFIDKNTRNDIIDKRISLWEATILEEYHQAVAVVANNLTRIVMPVQDFQQIIETFYIDDSFYMDELKHAFTKLVPSAFIADPTAALNLIIDYYNLYDLPQIKTNRRIIDILNIAFNKDIKKIYLNKSDQPNIRISRYYFPKFFI